MSPHEGFEILKNWQRTEATLSSSSGGLKFGMSRELIVKVLSIDSTLTLVDLESGQTTVREMEGAAFAVSRGDGFLSLEITFSDGRIIRLTQDLSIK
jgi:hypothetical protein